MDARLPAEAVHALRLKAIASQQGQQALCDGVADVNPPARGLARAPFDVAFTRPTPPSGG
jgi:hypothetical protein